MSLMRRLSDVNSVFRRRSSSASLASGRRTPEVDKEDAVSEGGDVLTPLPLARKLNMSPIWSNVKSSQKNVRRVKSFNIKSTSTSGSGPVSPSENMATKVDDSPESSPASRRKKHKPLLVKKLAAQDVDDPTLTGYMERRSISEQWLRYWYVLKGCSLFCYLTPDDTITVDILDVRGYRGEFLVDRFRGKRFVLHLTHAEYVSVHLSLDSREEMETWQTAIQGASGEQPSPQAIASETVVMDTEIPPEGTTYEDKCVSVKKKLLQEMLRQKHELERKQAARQRRSQGEEGSSTNKDLSSVEKQITYATNIRQRRLSTQIKMETITKQLQSQSTSNKRFPFSFGGKKKNNNQEHLKGQLQELNNKLQQIDLDLTSHINKSHSSSDLLDLNQNRKSKGNGVSEPENGVSDDVTSPGSLSTGVGKDSDMNRTNSLKNSVQKLAQKTFSKSVKSKKSKRPNDNIEPVTNGYLSDSMVIDRPLSKQMVGSDNDYLSNDCESDEDIAHKSDSLTDLTTSDRDIVFDVPDSNGTKFKSRKSNSSYSSNSSSHSLPSTPRKEVDPNIMAEIDAFEDFTKQMLGTKMVQS